MTDFSELDRILFEAKSGEGKRQESHISQDYERAYLRLRNESLIKAQTKESYSLLPAGERAIELGGYENWQRQVEKEKAEANRSNNVIIGSNNRGIAQGSTLRDLTQGQSTQLAPKEKKKQQNAAVSSIVKWIVGILSAVLVGVILLYIEHKTGFFSGSDSP